MLLLDIRWFEIWSNLWFLICWPDKNFPCASKIVYYTEYRWDNYSRYDEDTANCRLSKTPCLQAEKSPSCYDCRYAELQKAKIERCGIQNYFYL